MNNPLAGTDPSGYSAECEQALGKSCGDEPKEEKREKFKRGGSNWKTVYDRSALSNGLEVNHKVQVTDDASNIEQIGSQLEDAGYELTSGQNLEGGMSRVTYEKSYSGGTLREIGEMITAIGVVNNTVSLATSKFSSLAGSGMFQMSDGRARSIGYHGNQYDAAADVAQSKAATMRGAYANKILGTTGTVLSALSISIDAKLNSSGLLSDDRFNYRTAVNVTAIGLAVLGYGTEAAVIGVGGVLAETYFDGVVSFYSTMLCTQCTQKQIYEGMTGDSWYDEDEYPHLMGPEWKQ